MSDLILKRQGTLKIVFKSTKKNGVNVILSRYTGASELQSSEERVKYMKSEGFILPNKEILYINEIRDSISKALEGLLNSKGVEKAVFEFVNYSTD